MNILFTDNAERDAELIRQLHATRTLHRVCDVCNDADLRKAVVVAIVDHSQLVIAAKYKRSMQKLAFIFDLLGLTYTVYSQVLNSQTTPAAAHAASPTQHAAAAGQTINHHAHPASV